ncbi:Fic family protein [Candidatus Poriferisodalis sp.]|uniref:Fic family protein n=1 Tax=Candidatus Poriferisodalis sp. TaxID=3101277 RepID=UPI003D0F2FC9
MSLFEDGGAGTVVTSEWNDKPVRAWKPAKLSERSFDLNAKEARVTEQAITAVRTADQLVPNTWEALSRLLLRHEGIASSGIEGLREPLTSVLLAERTDAGGAAGWVADNLAVIDTALESAHLPLSVNRLHSWHARLMRNSNLHSDLIGVFRPRVGWVGGSNPFDAAYVPPPPNEISELIDDLIRFANEPTDLDPISHSAILHGQFEAIHPFGDGNGRLGRILVSRNLRRADLTRHSTVPISVAIARDTGGYLSGLLNFQLGNTGPWIRWFAEVVQKAAAVTNQLADRTRQILDSWNDKLSKLRSDSAAHSLLPLLIAQPVLSAPDAGKLLNITRAAGRNAIQALTDQGILEPVQAQTPGVGRNRNWYAATDLINIWSN